LFTVLQQALCYLDNSLRKNKIFLTIDFIHALQYHTVFLWFFKNAFVELFIVVEAPLSNYTKEPSRAQ